MNVLAHQGRDPTALHALAHSDVQIPVPVDGIDPDEPGVLDLPIMRQEDGTAQVPVFTSEPRLLDAMPDVARYRRLPLILLANAWPAQDIALVIDLQNPAASVLDAHGVRSLLGRPGS